MATFSAAWTGEEMLVWGGGSASDFFADGAAYNPAKDTWRPIPPAPVAGRVGAATVWTGRELVVWGGGGGDGHLADGAAYDLVAGTWRVLPPAPISPRGGQSSAWTGQKMLIWGGGDRERVNDGAAYSPANDKWELLPASPLQPRSNGSVAWTGERLLLWSGQAGAGSPPESAATGPASRPRWRRTGWVGRYPVAAELNHGAAGGHATGRLRSRSTLPSTPSTRA